MYLGAKFSGAVSGLLARLWVTGSGPGGGHNLADPMEPKGLFETSGPGGRSLRLTAMTSRSSRKSSTWSNPAEADRHISVVQGLDSRLRALRSTGELAQCSGSQLRSLLRYVDEAAVPAGFRVAVEGQLCSQFVIVIEGRLRAVSARGGCQTLGPGDSWGWDAMWDRTVNDATVVADSHARLLVMGHAQFRAVRAVGIQPEANAEISHVADRGAAPSSHKGP